MGGSHLNAETFLMTNPFRRPNIFRVRLRTLFMLVTVVAIVSGVAVDQTKRAIFQAKNIRLLRDSGAKVLFEFEVVPNRNGGSLRRYLRRKYGPDYVDSVHSVHTSITNLNDDGERIDEPTAAGGDVVLAASQLPSIRKLRLVGQRNHVVMTDGDMIRLANLKDLEHLEIRLFGPSDSGLEHLRTLTQLKYLDISGVSTTEKGLAHLGRLTDLQTLRIGTMPNTSWETNVVVLSDASASTLGKFPRLKTLEGVEYRLTDSGIRDLSKCTQLDEVDLSRNDISDAGATCLGRMAGLRRLILSGTRVGDETTAAFHRLVNLEVLSLAGTDVTDKTATVISNLPKLRELYISRTAISDIGVAVIQQSKSLRVLDVGQCTGVSDVSVRPLCSMPLSVLNTLGTGISDNGKSEMKLGIPTLTSLR